VIKWQSGSHASWNNAAKQNWELSSKILRKCVRKKELLERKVGGKKAKSAQP